MILDETYTLANGVEIPRLGLGTWFIKDRDAPEAVREAIAQGYRAIDTAQAYRNEHGVGEGIRASGVDREELFVSTKIPAEIKDHDGAVAAIDRSLEALGLPSVDLMLIHAPQPWADFRGGEYIEGNREVWRALEEAYETGRVRAIGVSNFAEQDLDNLTAGSTVAPHVNQILVHAGNTPRGLIEATERRNMLVQAYSPIGHGVLLNHPDLIAMAKRYDVTVPQLSIRYVLQLGAMALPKTADPEHMRANADVDFEISEEDMTSLKELDVVDYGEHSTFPVYSGV